MVKGLMLCNSVGQMKMARAVVLFPGRNNDQPRISNAHKYWTLVPPTLNIIKVRSYWKHLTAMTGLQLMQIVIVHRVFPSLFCSFLSQGC